MGEGTIMKNPSAKLSKLLKEPKVKDAEKLKKQQDYYRRLSETGTAKKQTYNLKPISAI